MAFFDQHATTGALLQGLNQDCVAISDAVGEKVGNFIHHLTTFTVGFAIGAMLVPAEGHTVLILLGGI